MVFSTLSSSTSALPRSNANNLNTGSASIAFAFLKSLSCTGFTKIQDCISLTATDYVLFGLDDSGAGPNDNHDDWMGLMVATRDSQSVVPLPAALPFLLAGLLGLGFVTMWIGISLVGLWILYRVVRGWLALKDGRAV